MHKQSAQSFASSVIGNISSSFIFCPDIWIILITWFPSVSLWVPSPAEQTPLWHCFTSCSDKVIDKKQVRRNYIPSSLITPPRQVSTLPSHLHFNHPFFCSPSTTYLWLCSKHRLVNNTVLPVCLNCCIQSTISPTTAFSVTTLMITLQSGTSLWTLL